MDHAEKKLKVLNNSLEFLKTYQKKTINYKLLVYNKLNWNNALINFNPSILDPVFVSEAQLLERTVNKNSQASLGSRDF